MRRATVALTIAGFLPLLVGFVWPGTVEWLCTRGVRQYEGGQFGEAGESFERALEYESAGETLQFNRGAALYRQGRFDEAGEAFGLAGKAGDRELARDAAYNLGNTHFGAGDYGAAVEAYKQALRIDPADMDAKHNLELALKKQNEQQQQQEQQDQQQESEDEEDDRRQDPQSGEGQQDEQQQEQQQQEQQQEAERQQAGQDEERGGEAEKAEEGELSAAQARRLLHALASQDAEMQRLIRRAPQRREPREGEKDW